MDNLIQFIDKKHIVFGRYPQSEKEESVLISEEMEGNWFKGSDGELYEKVNDSFYKVEPIKWELLDNLNGEMLVVAENILDAQPFAEVENKYSESKIREWLNDYFLKTAFNEQLQKKIITVLVENGVEKLKTSYHSVSLSMLAMDLNRHFRDDCVSPDTSDKIFLLSESELNRFIRNYEDRKRVATPYADARGRVSYTGTLSKYLKNGKGCGWWWLRTPFCYSGLPDESVRVINIEGKNEIYNADHINGVVPALYIQTMTDEDFNNLQKEVITENN